MDIKNILSKVQKGTVIAKDKLIIFGKFIFKYLKTFFVFVGKKSLVFFAFIGAKSKLFANKTKNGIVCGKQKFGVFVSNKKQSNQIKKLNKQAQKSPELAKNKDAKLVQAKYQKSEQELEKLANKEKNKKRVIISISAIIIIILLILLLLRSCGTSSKQREKENSMTFATKYAAKGEFDRALDKLDDFLQKYGDDDDVWDLWNKILEAKRLSEENGNGNDNNSQNNYPDNYSIDIDTSGLTDAMQNALDETRRQAEENRKAMEDLLRMQQQNPNGNGNNALLDDQKALQDKLAEERRLADEKKRAEEEKLANQNADLKKKIDKVNDEIQKGKDALKTGKINDANDHFRNALANVPNIPENPNYYSDKQSDIAQIFSDAADNANNPKDKKDLMDQAVNYANNALKQNPNDGQAHNILGQNAYNNKDYAGAEKEFNLATNDKNDPNRYLYYYNLGKVQYIMKKYNDAQKSFKTSCDLNSNFAPSRYNLGITQKQLKNITGALDSFKKTVQIDPYHEKALLEQARILSERNDLLGAIDAYKSVLKINSVNANAAMELGSAYYKRMNYADAIDSYKRAITMLSPGEQMTLTKYNLATALYDSGKLSDSLRYAKEAYDTKDNVKNNISKANVVYTYALLLDKTQKQSQAIPVYNEALKLNANHNKTKINLGNLYMANNPPMLETALQLYKEVYENESNNFEANNNLGSLYLAKNDYANSIKYYQNALRIQPKNNEVRENLAKTYAKNGDYDSAKITYTDLIKQDKTNWDAYIELAKVCMQLNQLDLADEYLTYVQVNNPSYRKVDINNLLEAIK